MASDRFDDGPYCDDDDDDDDGGDDNDDDDDDDDDDEEGGLECSGTECIARGASSRRPS